MAGTQKESPVSFRAFLEGVPPGAEAAISNLTTDWSYDNMSRLGAHLALPEITLHCETPGTCGGNRLFRTTQTISADAMPNQLEFLTYFCKNCSNSTKTFAVVIRTEKHSIRGTAKKFGEFPTFGPPTPARVISLIGPQRDLFLKGRRAENEGMGIAAFAYYRRVIEDQKERIFDEVIKVCNRLSAGQPIVDELNRAKKETQFSSAVDDLKLGIPQALFINGHNPLTLLHSALSEGLHAQTDDECLEIATSIRLIMVEFAERMGQALKDEAELSAAVRRLLAKKSKSGTPKTDAEVEPEKGN